MPIVNNQLHFDAWSAQDRGVWTDTVEIVDVFAPGVMSRPLAQGSKQSMKREYARFLGFLQRERPDLMQLSPTARVCREVIVSHIKNLSTTCNNTTITIVLDKLLAVFRSFDPARDWSWFRPMIRQVAAGAQSKPKPRMTSDRLYRLGIAIMDAAERQADTWTYLVGHQAKLFRDGLIIAVLAESPMRRRAFANIQIGKQLVRYGTRWTLHIPASDDKTGLQLEYTLSSELSSRMDAYLSRFRPLIRSARAHDYLWASQQGPLRADPLGAIVTTHTREAFGFSVPPHRFRAAAATFWSDRDPANVTGASDLLGHLRFATTEKHYIVHQSRTAGHVLGRAFERGRLGCH